MADPTLIVEVQLVGVLWVEVFRSTDTDEDRRLRLCRINRGKQKALDAIKPGHATLIWNNGDRHFDPEHNAFFQFFEPGKGVRVKAEYGVGPTTYYLFTGKLDRVTDRSLGPNHAIQIWDCFDGLADLEGKNLPNVWEAYMQIRSPRIWLPLNEKSGPIAFDRSGNARHSVYNPDGSPEFGVPGLIPSSPDAAVKMNSVDDFLIIPADAFPSVLPWTLNLWIECATLPTDNVFILYQTSYPDGLTIWIDTVGRLNVRTMAGGVISTYARSSNSIVGTPGFIATINARAGLPLRIMFGTSFDWSVAHIGTGGTPDLTSPYILASQANEIVFDDFQVFDSSTTGTEENELASAIQSWLGDSPNGRLARIRELAGWDHALSSTDMDIGSQFLKGTSLDTTALDHYQTVVSTLEGALWVDAEGILWAISARVIPSEFGTSVATYGNGPGELPYIELGDSIKDWELLTNVVRRYHGDSIMGETIIAAGDNDSYSRYGLHDTSPVADVNSELYLMDMEYDLAAWRVAHYKDPRVSVEGITIDPAKDPAALWPRVLGDDLNTRITLVQRPQNVGSAKIREMLIEGIQHDIAPKKWRTRYNIDATNALSFFLFDDTEWDADDWRFGV